MLAYKPAASGNKEQVKAVYDAIDLAFHSQSALLASELEDCKQRLQMICDLDEAEHNLKDAQRIAQQDNAQH